jgi:hypothetical protein
MRYPNKQETPINPAAESLPGTFGSADGERIA